MRTIPIVATVLTGYLIGLSAMGEDIVSLTKEQPVLGVGVIILLLLIPGPQPI